MKIESLGIRATPKRTGPPTGVMVHITGLGIVERATKRKQDPEEFAAAHYKRSRVYPDALIGYSGTIYTYTQDDSTRTAHATWRPWERRMYAGGWWQRRNLRWAHDYLDKRKSVEPKFFAAWYDRWRDGGRHYSTPLDIVGLVGGPNATPNDTYIGVELLSQPKGKPASDAQLQALAEFFVDKCRGHGWFEPSSIVPGSLPQAWLLGHDDVCPARRWANVGGGAGRGWDPGDHIDWNRLGRMIVEHADATRDG